MDGEERSQGKKEIPGSEWSTHGYILTFSGFCRENIVSAGLYPSGATFYLITFVHFLFYDLTRRGLDWIRHGLSTVMLKWTCVENVPHIHVHTFCLSHKHTCIKLYLHIWLFCKTQLPLILDCNASVELCTDKYSLLKCWRTSNSNEKFQYAQLYI